MARELAMTLGRRRDAAIPAISRPRGYSSELDGRGPAAAARLRLRARRTTPTASRSRCRARCSARSAPSRARMARAGLAARQGASRTCARCRKSSGARSCRCPTRRRAALAAIAERRAGGRRCRSRSPRRCAPCAGSTSRPSAFDERTLPEHLKLRVAVVDAEGRVLAASRDLAALQRELGAVPGSGAAVEAAPRRGWHALGAHALGLRRLAATRSSSRSGRAT